jgi:hypothetical protein
LLLQEVRGVEVVREVLEGAEPVALERVQDCQLLRALLTQLLLEVVEQHQLHLTVLLVQILYLVQ